MDPQGDPPNPRRLTLGGYIQILIKWFFAHKERDILVDGLEYTGGVIQSHIDSDGHTTDYYSMSFASTTNSIHGPFQVSTIADYLSTAWGIDRKRMIPKVTHILAKGQSVATRGQIEVLVIDLVSGFHENYRNRMVDIDPVGFQEIAPVDYRVAGAVRMTLEDVIVHVCGQQSQ